jgi:flagellar basal-body rod protein FlgF
MDRIIYTAMTGASASESRQAVLANNLANASTQGFKAELSAFRATPVRGDGLGSRVMAVETTTGRSDVPGAAQKTGRALDVMADGRSWFAVQGLDGTEAYTRAGSLEVSPEGNLVNASGNLVLSDGGGPLAIPAGADITIGADGTVSAKAPGQAGTNVGRLKMVTPDANQPIQRGADGLFRTAGGDPLASDPQARLQSGTLEGSNVNTIETMVSMIQVARQFEAQMRMLQTAEQNDKAASQLLNLQG